MAVPDFRFSEDFHLQSFTDLARRTGCPRFLDSPFMGVLDSPSLDSPFKDNQTAYNYGIKM